MILQDRFELPQGTPFAVLGTAETPPIVERMEVRDTRNFIPLDSPVALMLMP
jgi:hypothetical protein